MKACGGAACVAVDVRSVGCRRTQRWCADAGLSVAELARRLNYSRPMVSQVLNGHRRPGLELAVAIERASYGWELGPVRCEEWLREES